MSHDRIEKIFQWYHSEYEVPPFAPGGGGLLRFASFATSRRFAVFRDFNVLCNNSLQRLQPPLNLLVVPTQALRYHSKHVSYHEITH
jgi:hypothetical protein